MSLYLEIIKKDFSVLRDHMIGYGVAGFAAVAVMAIPLEWVRHLGSLLLIFVMVAFYCTLAMKAVVSERKQNNHLFLMTLPVDERRLAKLKLASVLLIFLSLWLPLSGFVLLIAQLSPEWPAAGAAIYTVTFTAYLPAFALILVVAMLTLSEAMTIAAFTLANMALVIFLNYFPNSDFMQEAFAQGKGADIGLIWPPQLNTIILVQGALFILFVAVCYWLGGREINHKK